MIGLPAVPLPLIVAVVAMAVGAGGAWQVQAWRWAAADAERVQQQAEANRVAEKANSLRVRDVDATVYHRLQAADRAAAADRTDAQRLRDELARIAAIDPADAGCADVRRHRDELAGLLREGASLVEEGLAAGDRLEVIAAGRRKLAEPGAEPQR